MQSLRRMRQDPAFSTLADGRIFTVRVTPKASRTAVVFCQDDRADLAVRVTVEPEGGKANKAVIAALAGALGVATSRITLIRGETSRLKTFRVAG